MNTITQRLVFIRMFPPELRCCIFLLELKSDVKANLTLKDMLDKEVEFIKKVIAILHFVQCQLKIFRNSQITC